MFEIWFHDKKDLWLFVGVIILLIFMFEVNLYNYHLMKLNVLFYYKTWNSQIESPEPRCLYNTTKLSNDLLVRKNKDINGHESLFNITL